MGRNALSWIPEVLPQAFEPVLASFKLGFGVPPSGGPARKPPEGGTPSPGTRACGALSEPGAQSAPEEALGQPGGDAAFADYSILASFRHGFKPKHLGISKTSAATYRNYLISVGYVTKPQVLAEDPTRSQAEAAYSTASR